MPLHFTVSSYLSWVSVYVCSLQVMEIDKTIIDQNMEEEYVLIDLDAVCGQVDIPPGEPYVLSVCPRALLDN